VEEIPSATAAPQVEVLSELKSMTQIMFDVETTSLGNFTIARVNTFLSQKLNMTKPLKKNHSTGM